MGVSIVYAPPGVSVWLFGQYLQNEKTPALESIVSYCYIRTYAVVAGPTPLYGGGVQMYTM